VAGVVNVRGRILTALHLQHFFGLQASAEASSARPYLVLVETPESEGGSGFAVNEAALVVQDVLAVQNFRASQIQESPGTIRGVRPEYVRGVTQLPGAVSDGLLVVLNLATILADKQLTIREEII
jgi:purine-binding chemotaxis protein CheW